VSTVVGVLLTLAPVLLPQYREHLPSAAAFGLAWVFHWYYGLLFFLGALSALLLERQKPQIAEEFTFPVASGVIAGGSLTGVVLEPFRFRWKRIRRCGRSWRTHFDRCR
jgi:hypothetical protein